MATIESKVPDIGGHGDVPVIEVLVAVGDTVKKDRAWSRWNRTRRRWKCPPPPTAWSPR